MRLKKGNVEREADGIKAERLLNDGFTRVEAVKMQSPEVSNKKDLSEMTAEELKNLAKEGDFWCICADKGGAAGSPEGCGLK